MTIPRAWLSNSGICFQVFSFAKQPGRWFWGGFFPREGSLGLVPSSLHNHLQLRGTDGLCRLRDSCERGKGEKGSVSAAGAKLFLTAGSVQARVSQLCPSVFGAVAATPACVVTRFIVVQQAHCHQVGVLGPEGLT